MNPQTASTLAIALALGAVAPAGARLADRLADSHQQFLETRRAALPGLSDPLSAGTRAHGDGRSRGKIPWHGGVAPGDCGHRVLGGRASFRTQSGPEQSERVGSELAGELWRLDDPDHRDGFRPASFSPAQNPFYIALPYNDVTSGGRHRPEASEVIPWFWRDYRGDGISVARAIGWRCTATAWYVMPSGKMWVRSRPTTGNMFSARNPRDRTATATPASISAQPPGIISGSRAARPSNGASWKNATCRTDLGPTGIKAASRRAGPISPTHPDTAVQHPTHIAPTIGKDLT